VVGRPRCRWIGMRSERYLDSLGHRIGWPSLVMSSVSDVSIAANRPLNSFG